MMSTGLVGRMKILLSSDNNIFRSKILKACDAASFQMTIG